MNGVSSSFIVLYSFIVFATGQNQYSYLESHMHPSGHTLLSRHTNVANRIHCAWICSQQPTCLQLQYCLHDGTCVLYAGCVLCSTNASTCPDDAAPYEYMLTKHLPANQTAEKYLVTGQDGVLDRQLSESSYTNDGGLGVSMMGKNARLNSTAPGGCWASLNLNDNNDYVQVDFLAVKLATCVVLTGRPQPADHQYVTSFRVLYSVDCVTFTPARDVHGNEQVFAGCSSVTDVVTRCFQTPISARCIRINPVAYVAWKSLRFDVLGY